jgi:hypothetical protein
LTNSLSLILALNHGKLWTFSLPYRDVTHLRDVKLSVTLAKVERVSISGDIRNVMGSGEL